MDTKWEHFLQNLGEWQGSFTQFSLAGEPLGSTNSIIDLESFDSDRAVRFRVRRFGNGGYDTAPTYDLQQEYRSLGRQILVFDTGAFSKGTLQVAPFSEFGAEYGFVMGDRRLRLVQLFNKQGDFQGLTLIREFRAGGNGRERSPLTVENLLGVWEGHARTQYADTREPTDSSTRLEIVRKGDRHLLHSSTLAGRTRTSTVRVEGKQLWFEDNARVMTVLPDGASSHIPLKVEHRQAFFVEAGWLVEPAERHRLIRHYDDKGAWSGSTYVRERKLS